MKVGLVMLGNFNCLYLKYVSIGFKLNRVKQPVINVMSEVTKLDPISVNDYRLRMLQKLAPKADYRKPEIGLIKANRKNNKKPILDLLFKESYQTCITTQINYWKKDTRHSIYSTSLKMVILYNGYRQTKILLIRTKSPMPVTSYKNSKCGGSQVPIGLDDHSKQAKQFKTILKENGYKLAQGCKCIDSKTPISIICPAGHSCSASPNSFLHNGSFCPECSTSRLKQQTQLFEKIVNDNGYKNVENFEYTNPKTEVAFFCPKGHTFTTSLHSFVCNGTRCPKCSKIRSKEQSRLFEKIVKDYGYKLDKRCEYINSTTKVPLLCPRGHTFTTSPGQFIHKGTRCSICSVSRIKFERIVKDNGYRFNKCQEYINSKTKISLICPKDHIYTTSPVSFMKMGRRCPKCSNKCPEQAQELFEKSVKDNRYMFKEGYKYKNSTTKVSLICHEGHVFDTSPSSFRKKGNRCPKCSNTCPKQAQKLFEKSVKDNKYKFDERYEYINARTKVALICPEGHAFYTRPSSFKNEGSRCPIATCSTFRSEKICRDLVEEKTSLKFEKIRLPEMEGLEFDMYNPDFRIAIEYQGQQHFGPVTFGGIPLEKAEKFFKSQQRRDHKKRILARQNNIFLLEVPCSAGSCKSPHKLGEHVHEMVLKYILPRIHADGDEDDNDDSDALDNFKSFRKLFLSFYADGDEDDNNDSDALDNFKSFRKLFVTSYIKLPCSAGSGSVPQKLGQNVHQMTIKYILPRVNSSDGIYDHDDEEGDDSNTLDNSKSFRRLFFIK
eukprot:Awhi_evm1s5159